MLSINFKDQTTKHYRNNITIKYDLFIPNLQWFTANTI